VSVIVSGPRRTYVLVGLCCRIVGATSSVTSRPERCVSYPSRARLVVHFRLHRVVAGWLVGLTFCVLALER
jgi:hypothetical protein